MQSGESAKQSHECCAAAEGGEPIYPLPFATEAVRRPVAPTGWSRRCLALMLGALDWQRESASLPQLNHVRDL